jgi:hypothetical protein
MDISRSRTWYEDRRSRRVPVQQSVKTELVINLKTAKSLRLTRRPVDDK